jgi:hypothetical protein
VAVGEGPPSAVGTAVLGGGIVGRIVLVIVRDGVIDGVRVRVGVRDGVNVFDGVKVLVAVGVSDGVLVNVFDGVNVHVCDGVKVSEGVIVKVSVGVKVKVQVGSGVRDGVWLAVSVGSTACVGSTTISGSRGAQPASTAIKPVSTTAPSSRVAFMMRMARPFHRRCTLTFAALIIGMFAAACQTSPEAVILPTEARLPAATPAPLLMATRGLGAIPTDIPLPTAVPVTPLAAPPTFTLPALPTSVQMPADAAASTGDIRIGTSAQGREISARRFGSGPVGIVLAGGMHGGWEANTVVLAEQLIAHFERNPGDLPPDISLYIVPAVNPDGLPRGRTPEGRFNARGVDLNRNWGCGWQAEAVWRDQAVSAGAGPFSEPETQALSAFLMQVRPAVALFYHSSAGGIFAGRCAQPIRDADSETMSAVYGAAAGYSFGQPFSAYPVTGTAAAWADGQGIAAADVELYTSTDAEFTRNLRGLMALMAWASGGS